MLQIQTEWRVSMDSRWGTVAFKSTSLMMVVVSVLFLLVQPSLELDHSECCDSATTSLSESQLSNVDTSCGTTHPNYPCSVECCQTTTETRPATVLPRIIATYYLNVVGSNTPGFWVSFLNSVEDHRYQKVNRSRHSDPLPSFATHKLRTISLIC